MVYLYDMIFVAGYLGLKQVFKCIHDREFRIFMSLRELSMWVEFSWILLAVYFSPHHSPSERAVSFAMCFVTKIVFGIVAEKKCKLNKNILR